MLNKTTKKFLALIFVFIFSSLFNLVSAKTSADLASEIKDKMLSADFFANSNFSRQGIDLKQEIEEIIEREGIYDVPGHFELKLAVVVHQARPKPSSGALVCTDPNSSAVVSSLDWRLKNGNWTYNLNPSSAPSSVGSKNLPQIAANAFSVWQDSALGKIAFLRGSNTVTSRNRLDGKNIIAWASLSGSTLGVTYTWYYKSTHLVAETDTILNRRVAWNWSNVCTALPSYDVQNVLTHELGHWMGLADHYTTGFVDNTMYGWGAPGEIKKDTLTDGDIAGIQNIY